MGGRSSGGSRNNTSITTKPLSNNKGYLKRYNRMETEEEKRIFNEEFNKILPKSLKEFQNTDVAEDNASQRASFAVDRFKREKEATERFSASEQELKEGLEKKFPPGTWYDVKDPVNIKVEVGGNSASVTTDGEELYRVYADNYGGFTVWSSEGWESKSYATVEQALKRVSSVKSYKLSKKPKK